MCHRTAKAESIAVGTVSGAFLPPSIHRKRLLLSIASPALSLLNSSTTFANPTAISKALVPGAGRSILITEMTINSTADYVGTITVTDGATLIGSYNVNYVTTGVAPANSTTAFANPAVPSVTITGGANKRVQLLEISINATAAYTGTILVKDGATTIESFSVSFTAGGNDVILPVPATGLFSSVGNNIVISGPAASAGNTVTYNVTANVTTLGNDVFLPIPGNGILGSVGNTVTIAGPAAPAGQSVTLNVAAQIVPVGEPRVTLSPNSPAILDTGLTLAAGVFLFNLSEEDVGDWMQRPWSAISNVPLTVSVVDIAERGPMQGAHPHEDDKYAVGYRMNPKTGDYERVQDDATAAQRAGYFAY